MGHWLIWVMLCQSGATTAPADPTMDWLLDQKPATQPATQPASQPTAPFNDRAARGISGTLTLSNGTTHSGLISTTPGKPLRLYDESAKRYVDLPLESIASMEAVVLWERDEDEWRFKESGSDIKIKTGQTYPARETAYRVKLLNGEELTGGVVAPIYVEVENHRQQFVLHKRDKGEVGQRLRDLVYVRSVLLKR